MLSSRIRLIITACLMAAFITSCSAADDVSRGLSKLIKFISSESPPPKPPPVPMPPNPQTAQRIQELIQQVGAGAKNPKEAGKMAALQVPLTGNRESYKQSLWEVVHKTVLEEMQYYANRFTRDQLREMTEQMTLEIVDEVANATPDSQQPQSDRSAAIMATIVGKPGSKNVRSGPGTTYSVNHATYPGDRVNILAKDQDQGGYIWYKVYFPNSSTEGWVAAQFVQRD